MAGNRLFFAPIIDKPGSAEFILLEKRSLAEDMKLSPPRGLDLTSHDLHQGLLSEFVLHYTPVHPLVIVKRMEWKDD